MVLAENLLGRERCRYERRFLHILRSSCPKSRKIQRPDKTLKHAHQAMRLLHTMFIKNLAKTADLKAFEVYLTCIIFFVNLKIILNPGTPESVGPKRDVCWGSRGVREV